MSDLSSYLFGTRGFLSLKWKLGESFSINFHPDYWVVIKEKLLYYDEHNASLYPISS